MTTVEQRHDTAEGRVPPHTLEAEESLLGAMLLSRDAIAAAAETGITGGDFYRPAHGHIYDAITGLYDTGEAADVVTVADTLTRTGLLDTVGGPGTLVALQARTPTTSSAGRYARIVAEHATLRRLIGIGGTIAELGYGLPADVGAAVDQAERLLADLADARRTTTGAVLLRDELDDYMTLLEARIDGTAPAGVLTGWADLDDMLGGLRPGQLVVVCGRPGAGKTAVAGQLCLNAAAAGTPTLLASIEMGLTELLDRFAAADARIPHDHLRKGRLAERDWQRLGATIGRFADLPLHILDDPSATIGTIRSAARKIPGLNGGGLVVVDYLQLVETAKAENRQVEVADISKGLKRLGRVLQVPVVALAQLNRAVEQRADKRPMLSDLRESGQVEQDADVVIGLYRDEYYHPDSDDRGVLEMGVLKQRAGPTGLVRVHYDTATQHIADMVRGV